MNTDTRFNRILEALREEYESNIKPDCRWVVDEDYGWKTLCLANTTRAPYGFPYCPFCGGKIIIDEATD